IRERPLRCRYSIRGRLPGTRLAPLRPSESRAHGGTAMRVKHVMTKDPLCCVPSDTAQHAASLMREAGAGAIPVVESQERRRLVGIVTDRDLCMKVVAQGCEPGATPVADCMTLKVVSCAAADSIQKATELMKENQIRRVTVIDTD